MRLESNSKGAMPDEHANQGISVRTKASIVTVAMTVANVRVNRRACLDDEDRDACVEMGGG